MAFASVFSFVSNIFRPAVELIDELHTSDEEKLKMQGHIKAIENELLAKVIEYESQLLASQTNIISAEATGHSWLQRNWRPITMLTFLILIVLDSFNFLPNRLPNEAWPLLQIGLGGYVVGRSAEKITKQYLGSKNTAPNLDLSAKG
jgi:hypothetical protein